MIQINTEKCIGCSLCAKDCIAENIVIKEKKALAYFDCFLCGHCVAVCPKGAITIPEYDMEDVEDYIPENFSIDSAKLLSAIKYRRSIRSYTGMLISENEIKALFQAGRYTATAKNTQGCRFIFIQERLPVFKELIWNGIGEKIDAARVSGEISDVPEDFRRFYRNHRRHPENDYLFRNAPAVMIICGQNPIDAALAAQNMELMAVSMGLGALYNGYLTYAIKSLPGICTWLDTEDKVPQVTMLLGHPDITYARTAPRRAADIVIR